MTHQKSLFDTSQEPRDIYGYPIKKETLIDATTLSRISDPRTSQLAAQDAVDKASLLHCRIAEWLSRQSEAMTAREIAEGAKRELKLNHEVETIRKRVSELEDYRPGSLGFSVVCGGTRHCKITGKMAETWEVQ